jgi:hypothetical protein
MAKDVTPQIETMGADKATLPNKMFIEIFAAMSARIAMDAQASHF